MDSKDKTLSEIIRTGDAKELDRRLQAGLRKPSGPGEAIRSGNLIEQLTLQRGISMDEAFRIATGPRESGKSYLEMCNTHEGWIEAREALGLGRPADA